VSAVGYGTGWWINQGDSRGAQFRREQGMPADAFMALGIYGQTVVVVPSERLVIARFGTTYGLRQAMVDICRLTADTPSPRCSPSGHGLSFGREAVPSPRYFGCMRPPACCRPQSRSAASDGPSARPLSVSRYSARGGCRS